MHISKDIKPVSYLKARDEVFARVQDKLLNN